MKPEKSRKKKPKKIIIMGAAGRDFHNFNILFRDNPDYKVICFTAAQIPGISGRRYPRTLAGSLYPYGIPVYPESELPRLIKKNNVDEVVLSYSDLSHQSVMEKASYVLVSGAKFALIAPEKTMLKSKKKVISVCAVRTGAGKSPVTRYIIRMLREIGVVPIVVRHPMPYGDLSKTAVQRISSQTDIDKLGCTIEEREEYESIISLGTTLYAGVDYASILKRIETEENCDVIIWDGGNNDTPFFQPDVHIVVTDALRPNHEVCYYPGFVNLLMADIIIINKVGDKWSKGGKGSSQVKTIMKNIKKYNPNAKIVLSKLDVRPVYRKASFGIKRIKGKRAVIVEDGPTLTHGGMSYGAGYVLAKRIGVKIVNVKKNLVGDIGQVFKEYKHLDGTVLPAMGYSPKEIRDLRKTIIKANPDVIIAGTPINFKRIINTNIPIIHAAYDLSIISGKENLEELKRLVQS